MSIKTKKLCKRCKQIIKNRQGHATYCKPCSIIERAISQKKINDNRKELRRRERLECIARRIKIS
jgi:hypothetical protein